MAGRGIRGRLLVCGLAFWLAGQGYGQEGQPIVPGKFYTQSYTKEPKLAFSFDDGPGASTPEVLAILAKHQVKATFFVNGVHVKEHPELLTAIHNAGHEIGDHTYGHANFYPYEKERGKEATIAYIRREMSRSREAIFEVLQYYPKLCRMPFGYHRPWLGEIAKEFDYALVNWTFGADWQPMPIGTMAEKYKKALRPGAILLMHDGGGKRQKMLSFVEDLIVEAKKQGFTLLTIGELLSGG